MDDHHLGIRVITLRSSRDDHVPTEPFSQHPASDIAEQRPIQRDFGFSTAGKDSQNGVVGWQAKARSRGRLGWARI